MTEEKFLQSLYRIDPIATRLTYEEYLRLINSCCEVCGALPKKLSYGTVTIYRNFLQVYHKDVDGKIFSVCSFCYPLVFSWTLDEIYEKSQQIICYATRL